ncbi:MAG: hypothetical protein KGM98_15590 [Bacteroidota bacterium]|nr:hypothetical protein [Bacteroidota bacterium]
MKTILLLIAFCFTTPLSLYSQKFSLGDLFGLTSMNTGDVEHFMDRQGFEESCQNQDNGTIEVSFETKKNRHNIQAYPEKMVEIRIDSGTKTYSLFTRNAHDFIQAKKKLIKAGYFHGSQDEAESAGGSMLFQRDNMSLLAIRPWEDSAGYYLLQLNIWKIPASVTFAEDLLQFDSYQYLASFFGSRNIKSDLYYFSKNELKKCSVLYNGTKRQAVFIWGDEENLNHLSYIIFSNGIPTLGAESNAALSGTSGWHFRSGIYTGMSLRELLKLNQADFEIYGNQSEFSFMVKPNPLGKIDFSTTALMLSCDQCAGNPLFNQPALSALSLVKSSIPLKVHDIILYPKK